jgi:hypothetical protein
MQKNIFFSCAILVLQCTLIHAQNKPLKSADDLAGILGDKNNAINKATVQTETEKTVAFQIEYAGFKEKDKSYKIKGQILNAKKMKIDEIEPVEVDLDPKAGLADLFFTFKQKTGKQYTTPTLDCTYVQFSVIDKKGVSSQIGGLESLGLDSKVFTFEYKKKWKLKGAAGQEVTVKLTPYKSAATIKQ